MRTKDGGRVRCVRVGGGEGRDQGEGWWVLGRSSRELGGQQEGQRVCGRSLGVLVLTPTPCNLTPALCSRSALDVGQFTYRTRGITGCCTAMCAC
eukprot:1140429-Pelagomonas_calceolata.AAC.6